MRIVLLIFAGVIVFMIFYAPAGCHSPEVREAIQRHLESPSETTEVEIDEAKAIHRRRIWRFRAVCGLMLIGTIYYFRRIRTTSSGEVQPNQDDSI